MKKEENKVSPINRYNILWVNIQAFITFAVLVLAILSLAIDEKYFILMEILVALDLFVMAFNNYRIYKRKNATILYVVVGIFLLIYALLSFLGVI